MTDPLSSYECPFCGHDCTADEAESGYCPECEWPLDDWPDKAASEADYRNDMEKEDRP